MHGADQPAPAPCHEASSWPCFEEDEIAAVRRVLQSGRVNYWTGGECRKFETEYARFVGVRHAVAVSNGTVALELALEAAGIGPGDEVIVPPRTFIASASAVVRAGATVVFADVDPLTQTLTAETILPALSSLTRAIVVVHLAGQPCDMDPILALARERNLLVIEDCAQAHGATYKGRQVGSLGDIAAFSFCQDKIITTGGEGGMVTTDDDALAEAVWSLKDHGKDRCAANRPSDGVAYRWLHKRFGTNARMTEMQAAIGRIQLRKLPDWLERRRHNAAVLSSVLTCIPELRVPLPPAGTEPACYKFYAFVRPECLPAGWSRDRIIEALRREGIPCASGSCSEIYLEEAFEQTAHRPGSRLPVARMLGETSLMFPVDPTLSEADMLEFGSLTRALFDGIRRDGPNRKAGIR